MSSQKSRRVSFSDRVYYSDDLSTSTVTTDDDASFLSDDSSDSEIIPRFGKVSKAWKSDHDGEKVQGSTDSNDRDGSDNANTETKKEEEEKEEEENEQVVGCLAKAVGKTYSLDDRIVSSILSEPPLVVRDAGVSRRPNEYLGGYQPEVSTIRSQSRFKQCKGFFNDAEEKKGFHEFGAWKRSRLADADELSKKWGDQKQITIANKAQVENEADSCEPIDRAQSDEPSSQAEGSNAAKPSEHLTTVVGTKEALKPSSKQELKIDNISTGHTASLPKPCNELEALETEILELKEKIPELKRQESHAKGRAVSELADLEEDTANRMPECREKAHHVGRKMRAKEEKRALKEKAMKSEDLIDHLRKSNQKMRGDAIKMKQAIADLKSSNQKLEEKNSFHIGFVSQFQILQKEEVRLEQDMQARLLQDAPKYKSLVRGLENAVASRDNLGEVEHRNKTLFLNCTNAMVYMLDDCGADSDLVGEVSSMIVDDEAAFLQQNVIKESPKIKGTIGRQDSNALKPIGSSRRKSTWSTRHLNADRHEVLGDRSRRRSETTLDNYRHRPRQPSSFRVPRISKGTASSSQKVNSTEDDSSTCSCTSVNSGSFSVGSFDFDIF